MTATCNRTEPADFCPTCGVRRYVPPQLSDYVAALPGAGWSVHFWIAPNDPASTKTRTELLGGWGITRTGEVYPLLSSESPDVTIEDAGDDFAFIARAAAPRRELDEIRREAHAERERQRTPLESGGTG